MKILEQFRYFIFISTRSNCWSQTSFVNYKLSDCIFWIRTGL